MINISKGRNIGIGRFLCGFDCNTAHFYPLNNIPLASENIASAGSKNDNPW